jgi:hypothetical protein
MSPKIPKVKNVLVLKKYPISSSPVGGFADFQPRIVIESRKKYVQIRLPVYKSLKVFISKRSQQLNTF